MSAFANQLPRGLDVALAQGAVLSFGLNAWKYESISAGIGGGAFSVAATLVDAIVHPILKCLPVGRTPGQEVGLFSLRVLLVMGIVGLSCSALGISIKVNTLIVFGILKILMCAVCAFAPKGVIPQHVKDFLVADPQGDIANRYFFCRLS